MKKSDDKPNSDVPPDIAEAVAEIVADNGLEIEEHEAKLIGKEIFEKFTSPLLIQRAAGASSEVAIQGNPAGGVESGRSVKVRNILINIKSTALALPSTLPALLEVYETNGTPDHVRFAMAAVFALYGWLMVLKKAMGISLTQRTAGVLRVMWMMKTDDVVSQDGLLDQVNDRFTEYKWDPITADELFSHLENLEKAGCIERAGSTSIVSERIRWRLKEQVKVTV